MNKRIELMEQNRIKLISAARKAFAEKGFADASMDDLTADVGLTRGALYHNFGDKRGLLAAVVDQVDGEMAARAQAIGAACADEWEGLLAEGAAYIEMALDPEVQRIVLRDGPAVLGDPSLWPSQDSCLRATKRTVGRLIERGVLKPLDVEAVARLLSGAAFNAALWVAATPNQEVVLPKAIRAFKEMAGGLLAAPKL
ncbi:MULTISPECIES: TetR/AcrR family transcriptional regulator [unclassified Mesorhizobium]|uniref:TetR/AcrR family transcriptional regulator n=1 Tax=unclassified Mesorhizobium TaxID=325217 RepID=UPI000FCC1A3B|nr:MULTISPECIES: TetR/AcrR family transcriptional regulator [unclassified Mesorhizobium]TIT79124.1 MAG: TetR family transcriptional regulator [Mesorhizobium sp.]TGP20434.1 TetR/AcrR family transcriptional regulator [Mesorhizobium sp. M1D.F.Ca.ET.231.01.1.1]TGP28431.1 TetR/AcrR family transcriptional regulator [Mesorhizobium sp. M1D.F.Ca.ET.234.01.1.1]TGS42580.1 TetR/AcrR family transcriptional regulator [Mesorhizobium sp. M1D.F.Ca.ET.184.01.1.1]TGS59629.1 TetR/AcrR family transcriptional regul